MALICLLSSGCLLTSCNVIKQLTGGQPGTVQQTLPPLTGDGKQPVKTEPASVDPKVAGKLAGYWLLGYQINDQVFNSSFRLKQNGLTFSGEGSDDHNNKDFLIEQGQIQGDKVIFFKKYDHPNSEQQTPVEYTGTVNLDGVPYMKGEFIVAMNGEHLTGLWEAEKQEETAQAQTNKGSKDPAQPVVKPPDHAPDLSGKWNTGFEYKFKQIQSTMWLEQHGDKLNGHGIDLNTNEKFEIEKGWYSYPRVTIIRKYPKIKGKGGVIPEHTLTFKAEVSWITDADYQGPYLQGKTDGGGNWEAQLVR